MATAFFGKTALILWYAGVISILLQLACGIVMWVKVNEAQKDYKCVDPIWGANELSGGTIMMKRPLYLQMPVPNQGTDWKHALKGGNFALLLALYVSIPVPGL
jgi:hypothetical protein